MNIGQASAHSGLPPKTIRYYESVGLVVPRRQLHNRYRDYSEADIHQLRFLRRARQVGFSLVQCRTLLALYPDPGGNNTPRRGDGSVEQAAPMNTWLLNHVERLDEQLHSLTLMRDTLVELAQQCADQQPERSTGPSPDQPQTPGMSFTLVNKP